MQPTHTTQSMPAIERILTLIDEFVSLACTDSETCKQFLQHINSLLDEQLQAILIDDVVKLRTQAMDSVLCKLFTQLNLSDEFALFAVGGYGRGDLAPYSDVDILLLMSDDTVADNTELSAFVASLWDIGITPALAVRTLSDGKFASTEHTVATALLEARFLMGRDEFASLPRQWIKETWTAATFFRAKTAEARTRYLAHNSTEYNLEPNLKTAPGGLRDIQIILWLGKFYFDDVQDLADLAKVGFLSVDEVASLSDAQAFLWQARHHLHQMNAKAEDRLLFSHQRTLAVMMGFGDESSAHATFAKSSPETMMHQYYRHAMTVAALSELLCDLFYHRYVLGECTTKDDTHHGNPFGIMSVDYDTETRKLIFTKDLTIFQDQHASILQLFLTMGKMDIKYIEPTTLQALRLASPHIPSYHHASHELKRLFLANLKERNYLFHRLRLMKRHGVLAHYLPHFGRVIGLMQYDLFHRYTVDAHTLLLLRILHRIEERADRYGLVTGVYRQIVRKDLLIIAALFHDLAKGLGGDHSAKGAELAKDFCTVHELDNDDGELVAWLVAQHLSMSHISQKQDVTDPDVIDAFAAITGDIAHLNHLYILTVADMSATNGELYNSWRATLLQQLYLFTHRRLHDGSTHDSTSTILSNRQTNALALLGGHDEQAVLALWQRLGKRYLLAHGGEIIAWHTDLILGHEATHQHTPLIALSEHNSLVIDATQILIYAPNSNNLFAKTVAILDNFELNVLAANILTDKHDFALDSYVVIDKLKGDNLLQNPERIHELTHALATCLSGNTPIAPKLRHHHQQENSKLQFFDVPTQIHLSQHPIKPEHSITIITKDKAGLLAKIGTVFSELGVWVHGAKIMTLGERAEDVFYISAQDNKLLHDEQITSLKQALIETL
ncbi:MAG: [protein-PII] uridylyltransferase [Moraxella sp.]|nr:[protein-PII] uridylyltransferase [Moraxella sp.]